MYRYQRFRDEFEAGLATPARELFPLRGVR